MSIPERRQIPRTAIDRLAYIHIEPDNGGIVLNLSGEGLCFHSFAPVERNGSFRFSLLEQNRRISVCGELAWTDEIQKIGGVRFTTLTTEARQQVETWISQPAGLGEEHKSSTLGAALLKAVPGLRLQRLAEKVGFPEKSKSDERPGQRFMAAVAAILLQTRTRMKLGGFSAGLATGLLVSTLWASIFLVYAHRRDIGEVLIHLGERLASKTEISGQIARAAPSEISSSRKNETPAAFTPSHAANETRSQGPPPAPVPIRKLQTPVHGQGPTERLKHLADQAHATAAKPQQFALKRPSMVFSIRAPLPSSHSADNPVQSLAVHNPANTVPPPTSAALTAPAFPVANVDPNGPAGRKPELANAVSVRSLAEEGPLSPALMYFDLGKFKDELWARNLGDKLAQLGLQTSVIQRGHLWMNSFQVLVGPYANQEQATKIHQDLLSHGYKPRPFERGSRNFLFGSAMTLNGAKLPVGDFTISWESYVTDAKVKFALGNDVIATADGRWTKQPRRYEHNEFVYVKGSNGLRTLVEIHFSGQDRSLVLAR
jgi:hypothetical protein